MKTDKNYDYSSARLDYEEYRRAQVDTCPYCHSSNLFEVRCDVGPHHARLGCRNCHRHVRFLPAPVNVERAARFELWFGKFKGLTLGQVAERDPGYLRWLAENVANEKVRELAGVLLEEEK